MFFMFHFSHVSCPKKDPYAPLFSNGTIWKRYQLHLFGSTELGSQVNDLRFPGFGPIKSCEIVRDWKRGSPMDPSVKTDGWMV